FSKAINMSGDNALDSESIGDVFNRRLDRVISSFNYPQYLKVTWIYELPFGPNKLLNIRGIGGKIIGGWSLTGNHFARSGNPLGIGVNSASNPITVSRPDQIVGVPVI